MLASLRYCAAVTQLLCFLIGLLHVARAADWTYSGDNGPENWPGICTVGKKQSPINIAVNKAVKTDLGILKFIKYNQYYPGSVTNNGHTVQVELSDSLLQIEGGDLPTAYNLEQLHFHWSSEHTINKSYYPLELHLVHYNSNYKNVSDAAKYKNGITVVGVLFELNTKDNEALDPILQATKHVSAWVGRSTTSLRQKINPYKLLPRNQKEYYRYNGSLTTPNCQESVMWFIFPQTVPLSKNQLDIFKEVEAGDGKLERNHRPVQDLGDRILYRSLLGYSGAKTTFEFSVVPFFILLLSIYRTSSRIAL